MTANPPLTAEHIEAAFLELQDLGIELPAALASDENLSRAAAMYARRLGAEGVTPAEIAEAPWGYVRRRIDHGGRRPWPDGGALLAAVQDARVARRPVFGEIREGVWAMIGRHFGAPSLGFDASALPAAVQDIAVEACVAAGVSSRGSEEPRFVMRDVEREYEARRARG